MESRKKGEEEEEKKSVTVARQNLDLLHFEQDPEIIKSLEKGEYY